MLTEIELDMRQFALRYDDVINLLVVSIKMFSTNNLLAHIYWGKGSTMIAFREFFAFCIDLHLI